MILQRDLQGSKVLWPQMERTCLLSGCALPSLFLTACKAFAKAGSTFFFPFLFCWIWFLIYFDLCLHINLEVSLHKLLGRCMLGLLVSAFLSPTVQLCKAAERCGGRQVENWESIERYHLFLHRIHSWHLSALALAPARAGWSISTVQMSSEYPWVLLPAAKRTWETSACMCSRAALVENHLSSWDKQLSKHSDHGESKGGPLDLTCWSRQSQHPQADVMGESLHSPGGCWGTEMYCSTLRFTLRWGDAALHPGECFHQWI